MNFRQLVRWLPDESDIILGESDIILGQDTKPGCGLLISGLEVDSAEPVGARRVGH
jgi:hypothetical protein